MVTAMITRATSLHAICRAQQAFLLSSIPVRLPLSRQVQTLVTPKSPAAKPWSLSARQVLQHSGIGRLAGWYARVQDKRPYLTQVCSMLVVWLCGDLSAQLLFPSPPRQYRHQQQQQQQAEVDSASHQSQQPQATAGYDPVRTLRHLTVGVIASIPTYKWFMLLHRNFNFDSKVLSILTKVAVQQLVYTPVFNTYFFSIQSLLSEASSPGEIAERLRLTLPTSIVNGWKVWTGVSFLSFTVVPPQFRSVFSGCVAVCWQSYLSWMNQKAASVVAATHHEASKHAPQAPIE